MDNEIPDPSAPTEPTSDTPPETPTPPPSDDSESETTISDESDTAPAAGEQKPEPVAGDEAPSATADDEPPKPVIPAASPVTSNPKGGGKKGLLAIAVVVVLVAVVAGAYILLHGHKAKTVSVKKDIPSLSYGVRSGDLSTVYPLSVNTASNSQLNAQLFEGLVRYQNQNKIVPLLATGWTNPNDTTWVFDLRHGVNFNSGHAMTSADVKYSLDYAVAHQNDQNGDLTTALANTIKSVAATSTYQVTITTNGPDPTLLNRLTQLLIFDSKATVGDPDSGTGPYVVKPATKLTSTSADLVATNTYWGGHVYTREVHMTSTSDESTLESDTAKGQFDVAGFFTDSSLAKLKSLPDNQIIPVEDFGVAFLGLNTTKTTSPLHSLSARQAVADALNIPAILKAGGVDGEQASQLIASEIPGYNPAIKNTAYNPTKAKQLLASVTNGSVALTLSYPTGQDAINTEIAKELDAVGFNVKPVSVDFNTLIGEALGGKTDLYSLTYASSIQDGLDIVNSVILGNADYSSDKAQTLATQASSTLDPSTRISLLQQIEQQVATDVPDVPLYTQTRNYVLEKPYHMQVDIPSADLGVYFWQVYQ